MILGTKWIGTRSNTALGLVARRVFSIIIIDIIIIANIIFIIIIIEDACGESPPRHRAHEQKVEWKPQKSEWAGESRIIMIISITIIIIIEDACGESPPHHRAHKQKEE